MEIKTVDNYFPDEPKMENDMIINKYIEIFFYEPADDVNDCK